MVNASAVNENALLSTLLIPLLNFFIERFY